MQYQYFTLRFESVTCHTFFVYGLFWPIIILYIKKTTILGKFVAKEKKVDKRGEEKKKKDFAEYVIGVE